MSTFLPSAYAIGFAIALVASALLVPASIWLAYRKNWLDRPDHRKKHERPTPDLGGAAIFLAFWLAVLVGLVLPAKPLREFAGSVIPVFVGGLVIFLTGIVDDRRSLSTWTKLTLQSAVACFLWTYGLRHPYLWIPFHGRVEVGLISLPITILWFLAVVNCINLLDGLDLLAVATSITALFPLVAVALHLGLGDLVYLTVAMMGALIPFAVVNRHPARLFMGDGGSLTIGYFFAVIALWAPIKRFTALAVFVPLIALLVPLGESLVTFIRRSLRDEPFSRSDRDHIHHRLLDRGWSQNGIVALSVLVTAIFAAFTVIFQFGNRQFWSVILGIFVLLLAGGIGMLYFRRPDGR